MNVRKKGGDASRSGLAMSKLVRALGRVHNPLSMNLPKDHDVEDYMYDDCRRDFRTTNLQAEVTKAEANLMVYNLISHIQKS